MSEKAGAGKPFALVHWSCFESFTMRRLFRGIGINELIPLDRDEPGKEVRMTAPAPRLDPPTMLTICKQVLHGHAWFRR